MDSDIRMKILFVCYGNTCRSPMAEAIFRNLLKQQNIEEKFEVDSAGISESFLITFDNRFLWNKFPGDWQAGQEPNDYVKVIMERNKIPINHRARQITTQDVSSSDYLIGMDRYNITELFRYVDAAGSDARVIMLGDFNPDATSMVISDPYFDNRQEDFEKCYEQINDSCKEFLKDLLKEQANKNQDFD